MARNSWYTMEPTSRPFRKENDLPSMTSTFHANLQGVIFRAPKILAKEVSCFFWCSPPTHEYANLCNSGGILIRSNWHMLNFQRWSHVFWIIFSEIHWSHFLGGRCSNRWTLSHFFNVSKVNSSYWLFLFKTCMWWIWIADSLCWWSMNPHQVMMTHPGGAQKRREELLCEAGHAEGCPVTSYQYRGSWLHLYGWNDASYSTHL